MTVQKTVVTIISGMMGLLSLYANIKPVKLSLFHTASVLNRVTCVQTNLDEEPEAVRDEFHNFLAKVISNWTDKRDQEELSIMNT